MRCDYVTPKTPRMACLNALSEIAGLEQEQYPRQLSSNEQAEIILHHLRDYAAGRLLLLALRRITTEDLIRMCFDCSAEVKSDIVTKINTAIGDSAA